MAGVGEDDDDDDDDPKTANNTPQATFLFSSAPVAAVFTFIYLIMYERVCVCVCTILPHCGTFCLREK